MPSECETTMSNLARYARTLLPLRRSQFTNRVWRRICPARPRVGPAPPVRQASRFPIRFLQPRSSLGENGRVSLLNLSGEIRRSSDWNSNAVPKLWTYALHYQEGLSANGMAPQLLREWISQWRRENPPGVGPGWDPYPLSRRIVAWLKAGLVSNALDDLALNSLAVQVRFLEDSLEYHLLGNHLFSNAKALVMAGLFFEGTEADKWYLLGVKIFDAEIREQFLDDGGHFERSPTYHALLVEDILDVVNAHQIVGRRYDKKWESYASRGLAWLAAMTRPDGKPSLFNDAAYGISPSLAELRSYAENLRIAVDPDRPFPPVHDLPNSGYARLTSGRLCMIIDAGEIGPSYLPGHSHCDTLSFELAAGTVPIIVDTGVSTYEIGARRQLERSTAAHNTVQLGSLEQSEIWAGFRVGRRA